MNSRVVIPVSDVIQQLADKYANLGLTVTAIYFGRSGAAVLANEIRALAARFDYYTDGGTQEIELPELAGVPVYLATYMGFPCWYLPPPLIEDRPSIIVPGATNSMILVSYKPAEMRIYGLENGG